MKKSYSLIFLFITVLCFNTTVFAQMVGDNVFLQGHFVEVGIAPNGGYGSTLAAPAGYHPYLGGTSFTFYDPGAGTSTSGTNFLGFVADYGADGWTVGVPPFFGDFYLPGTPQEGWAIEIGGAESDAYIPSYLSTGSTGYTGGLIGTNVSYSNSGGIIKGVWQGSKGALNIRQTTILDTSKLYFTVNVVLKNTGGLALPDIYYIRTVDPDNEETRTFSYTTINTITYQLPNPTNRVLVSATGVTYTNAYLGLGTKDCRAKCMIFDGGLAPSYSLDHLWTGAGTGYYYTQGFTYTQDVGIALEFNIGTLAAGDSTTLSYAYILNATYIDSALNATQPVYTVNGIAQADSVDTINLCNYPHDSVAVTINGGDFYHWSWAPDSFLTDTTGIANLIHSDSITSDITYTITGTNVAGGCNSIRYYLTLQHTTSPGPPVIPVSYCQGAPSVPLTIAGTGINTWWTVPVGGTGSATPPTPSTTTPGITIYYVSQVDGLCQSLRSPDTVTVKPLPVAPTLSGINPYCQGQPFTPFVVGGTGVLWYTTASGGAGSATAPTVNTAVPGVYTFYASQTVDGCEGPRASITTTVLDGIDAVFDYAIHYGCKGDTVIFNNTSTNGSQYLWYFGDGQADTSTSPTHVYLTQDTFTVKLYASNGGCEDSAVQAIPLVHPLHASFTEDPNILCQGSAVTFTNTSVGTDATYNWHFGNGVTDTNTSTSYTYNYSGVYTVQLVATDFIPCHDTASAIVYVDTVSGIDLSVTDTVLCAGTYVTFTGAYASMGNTGIAWYFGEGDSVKNVNPIYHGFTGTGTFTVSVTALYRACPNISTTVTVNVLPQPNIYLGPDTSICIGSESIILTDAGNAAAAGAHWLWSTGETGHAITVVAPGYYYATVNINNCYASDTVWVSNDCYMDIPNVFTPNGDGVNDYFYPRQYLTKGLSSFKMNIYNRWGQLIFETTSLDGRGWDGRLNDVPQPEGVFIYIIDATFKDGQKEHHQGNLTLLR